jgi:beta-glucosidase-like glycosyl hydrolase
LTAAITRALVRGLQFDDAVPGYSKMIATSKHFLAYHIESFAGDGQYRLSHSFNVSMADVLQYYFVPFRAALEANVSAVMCASIASAEQLPPPVSRLPPPASRLPPPAYPLAIPDPSV